MHTPRSHTEGVEKWNYPTREANARAAWALGGDCGHLCGSGGANLAIGLVILLGIVGVVARKDIQRQVAGRKQRTLPGVRKGWPTRIAATNGNAA